MIGHPYRKRSQTQLKQAYLQACGMDVQAFKPGNVSLDSPGHGMCAEDFRLAARCSAEHISALNQPLGERIRLAVQASMEAAGCNTNLGIVLLCAPLLQACIDHPGLPPVEGLRKVLNSADRNDTEAVFQAIALANPGGLGQRQQHDVSGPAQLPLVATMKLAASRDRIAAQYANGFRDLFQVLLPYFEQALRRQADTATAVTELFLYTLGRYPDSHLERKYGPKVAHEVSGLAREGLRCFLHSPEESARLQLLQRLDRTLKERALNPGTSADLCVAALLIHRLHRQAEDSTGPARITPHRPVPTTARAVQSTHSQ